MLARGAGKWIGISLLPVLFGTSFFVLDIIGWIGLLPLSLPPLVALFFRDPERTPEGEGVVSPADGKVTFIAEEEERVRVGVFMNIYDVHVNRAPLSGEVVNIEHMDGRHLPAFTKSSDANERLILDFRTPKGDIRTVQIAGTMARRIISYVDEGDRVNRGERIGMIAFGSRVDFILPDNYTRDDLRVEENDRVRAGESVVASLTTVS